MCIVTFLAQLFKFKSIFTFMLYELVMVRQTIILKMEVNQLFVLQKLHLQENSIALHVKLCQ